MSEPKRVVPQCLEFPDSLGHATKKEKKREKGKQLAPSLRFTIALPESNEETYCEFNYAQLVKSAEKKRRKEELRVHDENATNGLDPFDDGDEDKLREMAKGFEAKYGTTTAARKRHKHDDYVDLGAGYDENDSFIDNTDAYDEIVPREVTTAYGGFYINSGPLEFKPADDNSPVHSRLNNNNNNNNNEDEEEESSEDSGDDEEDVGNRVLQRMEKRVLSSSDDDDDEDDVASGDPPRKKHRAEENGEKKSNHDNVMKKKRKADSYNSSNPSNQQCDYVDGTTEKSFIDDKREILDVECSSEDQEEKKRAKYEHSSKTKITSVEKKYEQKKIEKKLDLKRFEKKPQLSSNGLDVKKIDVKKFVGKESNIDDAIESVVNAGRAEDESSRDTIDSGKSHCLAGTESECEELEKEETPLPDQLPDDIKDVVNKLKLNADKNREGKTKIFDDNFNSTLLTLEEKLRMLQSPAVRLLTYAHLAPFLRCNKATLVNRAKKLCLQDADRRMKDPLHRLKVIIKNLMPGVVEKYVKECQRVAEEKGFEVSPAEVDSSDTENIEKSKIPRKKFPWSTEIKKLIYEIACGRRHYFEMQNPRKESIETFVANYMESKVLPIWPGGWMRLQTLLKYSNPEPVEKRKQKKLQDTAVPNSLSTSSGLSSTLARQEMPGISLVTVGSTCQERAITPTNLVKVATENPPNFATTGHSSKPNETQHAERKTSAKGCEKNCTSPVQENTVPSCGRDAMAKISVVPTSQLIGQNKPVKSMSEKFNPMVLTSGSLSITPVNDYSKTCGKSSLTEVKKDVVSITPYSEPMTSMTTTTTTATTTTTTTTTATATTTTTTTTTTSSAANDPATSSGATKNNSEKQRTPQENSMDLKSEKKVDERSEGASVGELCRKAEKREKRRDRWHEDKHRSQETKKRRKEHQKCGEQRVQPPTTLKNDVLINPQTSTLTKEEQEQRQIEETMAATNFLSQIINDDLPSRGPSDKRKEQNILVDENITNIIVQQTSEQDNDVQMVMRSLKELQELQEMKYSPSHSPIGTQQKSNKSSHQYVDYQDDYPRIYNRKDEKIRVTKEETSTW